MQTWFVRGFGGPGHREAILDLQKQGLIQVSLWKGGDIDNVYNLSDRKLWKRFQLDNNIHSGKPMPVDENYYLILSEFMEDSARNQLFRGLPPQELQHIMHIYYDYLSNLLKKYEIDTVLFSSPPHLIDKLLYRVACNSGIRTVICYQSIFNNRFFYSWNLEDFGEFKEIAPCFENPNLKIENKHEMNLWYMNNRKKAGRRKKWPKPCAVMTFNALVKEYGRRIFSCFPWSIHEGRHQQKLAGIIQNHHHYKDFKRYTRSAKKNIDLQQPYVYFPLHLQPEATTSALGDAYVDQILAIEYLALLLPSNWKIYVKENPKQTWSNYMSDLLHRGTYFFQRLNRLQQAVYLDGNIDTWELTRHSKFVATVTGTAGWEAIKGGKPVLIFAKAWYATLPGVFQYSRDINPRRIANYQIDHAKLERKINALLMKAAVGVTHDHGNEFVENYSHKENNKFLEEFFRKVLL